MNLEKKLINLLIDSPNSNEIYNYATKLEKNSNFNINNDLQNLTGIWETDGVRSVENIIKVDDQSSWKDKAKDLLITSQFKVAIVANNNIKSNNFNFTTINKNLYIFGIARNEQERKTVINEAKSVQGVSDVIPSIFLKDDLSNNQRIAN